MMNKKADETIVKVLEIVAVIIFLVVIVYFLVKQYAPGLKDYLGANIFTFGGAK